MARLAQLSSLHPCKSDVTLIDRRYTEVDEGHIDRRYTEVTWEQLLELPIPMLSANTSLVFLWVGHGAFDGLEGGR